MYLLSRIIPIAGLQKGQKPPSPAQIENNRLYASIL